MLGAKLGATVTSRSGGTWVFFLIRGKNPIMLKHVGGVIKIKYEESNPSTCNSPLSTLINLNVSNLDEVNFHILDNSIQSKD